jgi:predicted nucleic acid-binding protein
MQTKKFLFGYDVLALDSKSADIAAKTYTDILRKGKDIGLKDLFIAAIALSYNAPILTRNVKHFQNVEAFKVEERVVCLGNLLKERVDISSDFIHM